MMQAVLWWQCVLDLRLQIVTVCSKNSIFYLHKTQKVVFIFVERSSSRPEFLNKIVGASLESLHCWC